LSGLQDTRRESTAAPPLPEPAQPPHVRPAKRPKSSSQTNIVPINGGFVFINLTAGEQAAKMGSMKSGVFAENAALSKNALNRRRVPAWLKWAYTAFMAVFVPVYWVNYGPTNFLYFCDASLFLTLFAVWRDNALPASMSAVGILIPQFFWCVDFGGELLGFPMTSMTSYMFDANRSLFLRGLSLFHGWLPFLLCYLVFRLGYDRRALKLWTILACVLCLIAFFLLKPAGAILADPKWPRNVNYVFGLDDAHPQTWMAPRLYLVVWFLALFTLAYVPTHLALTKLTAARATRQPL